MYIHIALRIVWRYLCTAQRRWFVHSETHGIKSRPRLRIKSLPKFWKLPRVPGAWHDSTLGVHFNEWMAREGHRFGLTTSIILRSNSKRDLANIGQSCNWTTSSSGKTCAKPFQCCYETWTHIIWTLKVLKYSFLTKGLDSFVGILGQAVWARSVAASSHSQSTAWYLTSSLE